MVYIDSYVFFSSSLIYCSFPQATNQTLLDKFKRQHEGNSYIEFPAVMEPAFIIRHYAGKVKYGVKVRAVYSMPLAAPRTTRNVSQWMATCILAHCNVHYTCHFTQGSNKEHLQ